MKAEKNVYKGMKWVFSFGVGLSGLVSVVLLIILLVLNTSLISSEMLNEITSDSENLLYGIQAFKLLGSPVFIFSMISNLVLYGFVFCLGRTFFKNLEQEQIFVAKNVLTAKKISVVLLILSITSCVPNWYVIAKGYTTEGSYFDVTLVFIAAIVWALAKILEKANAIAKENELTI